MGLILYRIKIWEHHIDSQAPTGQTKVLLHERFTMWDKPQNARSEALRLVHHQTELWLMRVQPASLIGLSFDVQEA